jgi:hypothetical protein
MTTPYSHNNKNADAAFEEFSRNISICMFNRMLGIVSLVLIITSSIFLLLCYWLLTGSKYVEKLMVDICADIDITYFQSMVNEVIQIVSDKVNGLFGRNFVSKTNIKNEFSSMLDRHLAPDWAVGLSDEEEVSDIDSDIDIGNIDDIVDINDTNETEIKTENITTASSNNNNNEIHENITSDISVETSDDSVDSEIVDITQQCIAEREQNRTIIDLQSDNED